MKILITGGNGFIGHHVVEHLIKNTMFDIDIIDRMNYASSGYDRLRDVNCYDDKRIRHFCHDLTMPITEGLAQEIGNPDYILHMAAETHVDRSLQNAIPFAKANVLGTTNFLEWLKGANKNLKRYIQFSTDECYGPAPDGVFFKEWDRMKPSNPYAASKAGADMMAFSFAHAFGLPISISRTMNCFSERQDIEKFVPRTIKAILNNEKVILHGSDRDNLSSRCWIHARNIASALLFLLDKAKDEEMYHIVGEEHSVLEVANIISQEIKGRDLFDDEIEFVDFHKARKGHDKRYAMSGEKLQDMGWKPTVLFEESLRRTIQWSIRPENRKWIS